MDKAPFAAYGFDMYKDSKGRSCFKLRPFGKKWPTVDDQCEEHTCPAGDSGERTEGTICEGIEGSQVIE